MMANKVIFVFGSNLAGRHGAGAAKYARQNYGAIYGQGIGRQGDSYGIPTKDGEMRVLPLSKITKYVDDFLLYARANPHLEFYITAIGTGLAGYKHHEIAPKFEGAPENCRFPEEWKEYL